MDFEQIEYDNVAAKLSLALSKEHNLSLAKHKMNEAIVKAASQLIQQVNPELALSLQETILPHFQKQTNIEKEKLIKLITEHHALLDAPYGFEPVTRLFITILRDGKIFTKEYEYNEQAGLYYQDWGIYTFAKSTFHQETYESIDDLYTALDDEDVWAITRVDQRYAHKRYWDKVILTPEEAYSLKRQYNEFVELFKK